MTPSQTLQQQQKEFEKEFGLVSFTWNGENKIGERFARQSRKKVKSFLADSHSSLLSLIEEWVKESKKEEHPAGSTGRTAQLIGHEFMGYNQALSDLLEFLKL